MNEDVTIIEKYQKDKARTIAIKPYFNSGVDNMGLEKYNMTLFDGVWHHETIACLERNGIARYVTGLNEFAPEVKMLEPKAKKLKIKEIRTAVCELEKELAANVIDVDDKDFWNKVQVLRPDNHKFWEKISLKVGNEAMYLDPAVDPYDLIKLYAIEAGGFSIIAPSLEVCKLGKAKFYLDKVKETASTRTGETKVKNRALSSLQNLYDTDTTKLLYVTKIVDANSTQYIKGTPVDVLYEAMDSYINGESGQRSIKKASQEFLKVSNSSMEDLKIRSMIKDAIAFNLMTTKSDGYIYDKYSGSKLGVRPLEVLEYLKNPANDETLQRYIEEMEELWDNEN
jgi:hypothetical protein|tara:strand:- start:5360 stop:6379 length:1020 start_codon:yes stop_codon:yes gene_type:complete